MRKTRTPAGKLDSQRTNAREAAVLELGATCCATVEWNYAQDGGAVGDINFGTVLPAGAIILDITSDVLTTTVGADDVTIKAGSTTLKANIDLAAATGVEPQTPASRIKLAADSELKMTIATNPATAGRCRFLVQFVVSK